jgi:hypothetical protein
LPCGPFLIFKGVKMTTQEGILKVRAILEERYANYWQLPGKERVLLAAAVLADDIKVRETSNNHGEWVEAILGAVNLPEGYPWCAAMIEFCCDVAKYEAGPSDRASAAVDSWYQWAKANGKITANPSRGDLCLWKRAGGNHIGIINQAGRAILDSIEGNTTPGVVGNQRDGGGCYRRTRSKTSWTHFIVL